MLFVCVCVHRVYSVCVTCMVVCSSGAPNPIPGTWPGNEAN